jgi:hypothetical protein
MIAEFLTLNKFKFHENPRVGSRVVLRPWTEWIRLIVAFRNFDNLSKKAVRVMKPQREAEVYLQSFFILLLKTGNGEYYAQASLPLERIPRTTGYQALGK